jgi:hypothetical protein
MKFANDARAEKQPRPKQLESLQPEQLVSAALSLAMELSVIRERLFAHQALLEEAGILSCEKGTDFTPDADESKRRADSRNALVEAVIERLRQP